MPDPIRALLDELRAQAAGYRTVLALGDRQQQALERQDIAQFHQLLHEKAKAMARISELERASAPHREAWEAQRDAVPDELRAAVRDVVDELRGLLEALLEKERACEATLEQTKVLMQAELRRLGEGRRALRSYGAKPDAPGPGRLDVGG